MRTFLKIIFKNKHIIFQGASTAIMLVLNIGASLLAFYAFIKFLDDVVLWFGHFAGWDKLSFSYILGYILYPVAFLIGIEGKV